MKLAIIGEAWGEEEAQWKMPFIGAAGKQLDSILEDAGIPRNECSITNVFNLHPPSNNLAHLCCEKGNALSLRGLPALIPGKYLRAEFQAELDRLFGELNDWRPNVALLLGNTACWALLQQQAISKIRGTAVVSPVLPWLKCLPTYHPAAVLRQYDLRHVTVLDFIKAKREAEFPELRRPDREIWIEPTLDDIREFKARFLDGATRIAFDIETANEQVTCIGFAGSHDRAICIPFVDPRRGGNYWPSAADEATAWNLVQEILRLGVPKVGQNTLYDIQYLWMKYGIDVHRYEDDTMLLHHSLHPESEKGLGFLGSVYTNEGSWKTERMRGKHSEKREDE